MIKKLCFILAFLITLNSLSAQGNLTDLDYKVFRFGFSLGTNYMDFGIEHSEMVQNGKIYYADVSSLMPGFSVGLITDLRLHRYFSLRFTPALLIGERTLSFRSYEVATGKFEDDKELKIFSLPVDLPVNLRFSAERYGNFRPYVQVGVGTYFDLGRDEKTDVTLDLNDFYFSGGVGCDLYFKYFKLSPELKFNFGQTNILSPKTSTADNLIYTNALSGLLSRIIVFNFNIE